MSVILIFLLLVAVVAVITFVLLAARSSGQPYEGQAPHQGKVVRFTGTSSQVIEEDGKQRRTGV
jgi:hypothetical protein